MKTITTPVFNALLRFAFILLAKIVRLLYIIKDFIDDGELNASLDESTWLSRVHNAINQIENACEILRPLKDETDTAL